MAKNPTQYCNYSSVKNKLKKKSWEITSLRSLAYGAYSGSYLEMEMIYLDHIQEKY